MQTQLLNKIVKRYNTKTSALTKADEGFTLIELMVVIVIVGILSSVGAPQLLKAQDAAKNSAAKQLVVNQAKECAAELLVGDGTGFTAASEPSGVTYKAPTCGSAAVFDADGKTESWSVTLTDGFPQAPVKSTI